MFQNLLDEIDLLQRHFLVLHYVREFEPIGIVSLSKKTGYSKYQVRNSLATLEENDVIEPTQNGAITTDKTPGFVTSQAAELTALVDRMKTVQEGNVQMKAK